MRYFYFSGNELVEYFGIIKSAEQMTGYAKYNGTKTVDWLSVDKDGLIVELTQEQYEKKYPFVPENHRYSALKVVDKLIELKLFDTLTDIQRFRLCAAQDLGFDYPEFVTVYQSLKTSGVDTDSFLKQCLII